MSSTCQHAAARAHRATWCTRENGLLTRDHEFSSGYSGVSTCGDSDGLRARAPRRSPVREERSDAKDVGKIDSPAQRGLLLRFVSATIVGDRHARPWRETGSENRAETSLERSRERSAKCQRGGTYLTRAAPTIGAM